MKYVLTLIFILVAGNLAAKELSIISYNTYLLPKITHDNQQDKRSKLIGEYLNSVDADIICLQEVFNASSYKALKKELHKKYPYDTGAPFRKWFKLYSSGLVIFSKYPISKAKIFPYKKMARSDALGSKGAQFTKVEYDSGKFLNVMNTHLQARRSKKYRDIRKKQLAVIKSNVIPKSRKFPLILAGDFNILKSKSEYNYLLQFLQIDDQPITSKLRYTVDSKVNTFVKKKVSAGKVKQTVIDYIFLKDFSNRARMTGLEVLEAIGKDGSYSDHQPLLATILIY